MILSLTCNQVFARVDIPRRTRMHVPAVSPCPPHPALTCPQLSNIPDSFQDCVNLTALHVSANRFRQLPRCIDNLVQLRQLWASNNELIGLPTSLAALPNLVELQVYVWMCTQRDI